ncbi:hypothetical protein RG47T_0834 [Mucilaginibacter polytrichastri]|uniref:Uncharacterized protein n=1 Tax=Mucilaginibacter polytrichastri TaxID=1302689 RepID=A0A1Q5ZUM7_9SPHI|nr:hypothetical protein RG47T_0834 [Mucilaginibacter polytrichastri]
MKNCARIENIIHEKLILQVFDQLGDIKSSRFGIFQKYQ